MEVRDFELIRGEGHRPPVGFTGFGAALETAEEISAGSVEQIVVVEADGKGVDLLEGGFDPSGHRLGDRVIESDDGRRIHSPEYLIEGGDLRPIGFRGGFGFGVEGGDGGLDLIGSGPLQFQASFGEEQSFGDGVAVPEGTVLVLEGDELAVTDPSVVAGILQEQESEQPEVFGLMRE